MTPLGKDCAMPDRAAATSSIPNPAGTATSANAAAASAKTMVMRDMSECLSATRASVALPMAAQVKQAVARRPN